MKNNLFYDFGLLFHNKKFWISILGFALVGILGNIDSILNVIRKSYSGGNLVFFNLAQDILYSSISGIMIPVFSVLGFSLMVKEEIHNGIIIFSLVRTTKKRYILSKVIVTFISGSLMMFLAALLIYIITMMISYPDKYQCVMLEKYLKIYLSQFGINLLLSSLNGGLWASVGAVISLCFKEKFSGYFGAFAFFYILAGLQERYYMGWQYLNPINWISPVHTSWEILIILLLSLIVFMLVTLAFSIRRKLTR